MTKAKLYTFRGQRMTIAMVMDLTGWSDRAVTARRHGDIIEDRPIVPRSDRRGTGKRYLYGDQMLTVREIAARTGHSFSWVYRHISGNRIIEHNTLPRDIPINSTPIFYNGETRTPHAWARHLGIDDGTLYSRLYSGWPVKRALTRPVMLKGQRRRNAEIIATMISAFRIALHQPGTSTHTGGINQLPPYPQGPALGGKRAICNQRN